MYRRLSALSSKSRAAIYGVCFHFGGAMENGLSRYISGEALDDILKKKRKSAWYTNWASFTECHIACLHLLPRRCRQ